MATTAHSPNRKPRWKAKLSYARLAAEKKLFVELIYSGQSYARACTTIKVPVGTVKDWEGRDEKFHRKVVEARQMARDRAEGILEDGLPKAAETMVETLEDKDSRLRLEAATRLLRGRGLLTENPIQVNNAINKTQINIIIRDENAKKLVEQIMSGERLGNHNDAAD